MNYLKIILFGFVVPSSNFKTYTTLLAGADLVCPMWSSLTPGLGWAGPDEGGPGGHGPPWDFILTVCLLPLLSSPGVCLLL